MRILVLMIGSPGCGKDYFLEQNGLKQYSLSADEIRLMYQGPITQTNGSLGISQKNDKEVWSTLFELLEKRMDRGEFTIVNACHSKETDFSSYKRLAERYRYRTYGIDLRDVPIELCKQRNAQRLEYKRVPEDVIDRIYARFANQKIPNYILPRSGYNPCVHIITLRLVLL